VKIEKYDVTLRRIDEDDLKTVRGWRNHPEVVKFMDFQEFITPGMQRRWFQSINNSQNYYFVVEFQGKSLGVTNFKDIDYQKKTAEAGVFYPPEHTVSDVPFRASLAILDFGFEQLELKSIDAHILKDNKRAIRYNKALGFTKLPDQEAIANQRYTLSYDSYMKNKSNLIKYLQRVNPSVG
jgi:UDP-4-amino-4,6-dideoxy-N-acetyl-beta-L-altrosamine N-acetyltransferase